MVLVDAVTSLQTFTKVHCMDLKQLCFKSHNLIPV